MPNRIEKAEWRRKLRRIRAALPEKERAAATRAANRFLKRFIRRGHRIGIYWPVGSEMRLDGFIQTALSRGAELYLPYIEPRSLRLWFTPYQADAARAERGRSSGRLHIPQFGGRKIRAHRLHMLCLPLVGIDRRGCRLGQGGGYYDVSLAALKGRMQPHTVGVGFACQLRDELPCEAHDMRLDTFVCERGIIRF